MFVSGLISYPFATVIAYRPNSLNLFELLLGTSLFALVAFVFSDILRLIPKIKNIQERFYRCKWYVLSPSLFLFVSAVLILSLLIFFNRFKSAYMVEIPISTFIIILSGGWLLFLYIKSKDVAAAKLEFRRVDYVIPVILIIIVIVSFIYISEQDGGCMIPEGCDPEAQIRQTIVNDLRPGETGGKKLSLPWKVDLGKKESVATAVGGQECEAGDFEI